MSAKLHNSINRHYVPLTKDSDDTVFSAGDIDRAFEMVKQFTPVSWGGAGIEGNAVFTEAVRLIDDGLIVDPRIVSNPSKSHTARYAHKEIHALMNAAALAIVDIERENGRAFTESNLPALYTKTMQEMYTGKNKIQIQQLQRNAGLSH